MMSRLACLCALLSLAGGLASESGEDGFVEALGEGWPDPSEPPCTVCKLCIFCRHGPMSSGTSPVWDCIPEVPRSHSLSDHCDLCGICGSVCGRGPAKGSCDPKPESIPALFEASGVSQKLRDSFDQLLKHPEFGTFHQIVKKHGDDL